jgi:hypothetical protein
VGAISIPRGASRGVLPTGLVSRPTPAITGTTSTWVNVTPPDMDLDPSSFGSSNYGSQGVRADPALPGVFYTTATYQALWRSTDFGLTWTKVVISGLDPFLNARPNFNIACDGSYAITTALYNAGGGIQNGCWRSSGDLTTWTRYQIGFDNGDDVGRMETCPYSANRIVATAHSGTDHLWESRDGGLTWTDQGSPGGANPEAEMFWINADTLLAIPDSGGTGHTYRGVRSSSTWPWTWTWTDVDTQQHYHGTTQPFKDRNTGAIWTGGNGGIRKSTDAGLTWTQVSSTISGGILATETTLFATAQFATGGSFGPDLQHAGRLAGGTSWTNDTEPSGFINGWLYGGSATDGAKWAVVGGCWNAGVWRYVEP